MACPSTPYADAGLRAIHAAARSRRRPLTEAETLDSFSTHTIMAFELWQSAPSPDGGIHKLGSTPVKLSGFDGIIARRIARGDVDAGEELALDAAAVAALHPGGAVQSPMFTWSPARNRGNPGAAGPARHREMRPCEL